MAPPIRTPDRILVRVPNWVGDMVMSLPALEALRRRFPKSERVVLVRSSAAGLYSLVPGCDRVIPFEHTGRHRGLAGRMELVRLLREESFDLAVLFQNAFEAALLARLAWIPQRLGYSRDARGWLLTHAVPVARPPAIPVHESYYYLELLRRAGLLERLPKVESVELRPGVNQVRETRETLRQLGAYEKQVRVVVAPGAAYGSAKCWLPERFAVIADELVARYDACILLCGTPAEETLAREIAGRMKTTPVNLVGKTSLAEFVALLGSVDFFLGNDSGAMHLAAAVGLPQVIIFGPTDEHGTAPLNPRARLVRRPTGCSPCFLRHCLIDHRCMSRVTVEEVLAAVENGLAGIATRK